MKRFADDKNIKLSLMTSKTKALLHEGNMKGIPAGRAQAARPGRMEAKFRGFGYGFPVVVYIRKAGIAPALDGRYRCARPAVPDGRAPGLCRARTRGGPPRIRLGGPEP